MALPWTRQRQRTMNSSPAEFRRVLVQAFGAAVSGDDKLLRLATPDAELFFRMMPSSGRQLGLLHIAALQVEIGVERGDDAAVARLLAQVNRATLRGGG